MKIKIVCIVLIIICISLLVLKSLDSKQTIYIKFEDINGYSYQFVKDSAGQEKYVKLMQEGKFSYISWQLDIETDKIRKMDYSFIDEVDVISQHWIINNFSGLQIETNPTKQTGYNINVLNVQDGELYLYPVSCLHYLIE